MSQLKIGKWIFPPALVWLAPAAATGMAAAMVITYIRSEDPPVAGGARLYPKAAHEALEGLRNPPGQPAAAVPAVIPALPAGLSPNDYYWCDKCKVYHKRQAAGDAPPQAAGTGPAATPGTQPNAMIPPLPPEFSPYDYYWCPDCKAYHPRQGPGNVPPAMLMAPEPAPAVTPPAATPPPAAPPPATPPPATPANS